MSSLTSALRIANTGMQTSQVGLGTISHNIVNANTAGYSRQVVNTASTSIAGSGSGVSITNISRSSSSYYFQSILKQQSELSYAATNSSYLQNMESSFSNANGSGGLGDAINSFFDSVQQLSNEPGNTSLKASVIQQADLLADNLNTLSSNLSDMQTQADKEITDQLSTVNQTIKQVYELNVEIARQSQGGGAGVNVSDLQDKRDALIQSLSEDFKLQVTVDSSTGGYRIATESGRRLVDETGYVQFERTAGTPSGIGFRTTQAGGTMSDTVTTLDTSNLTTGRIKALVDLRDTTLPNQLAQLDNFATTFAAAVNQISSTGTSIPPQSSLTFTNVSSLATATSDLFAGFGSANVANTSFNISVVDTNGNVVRTTAGNSLSSPAVAASPITLPGTGPYTLTDLMNAINNDPTVGSAAGASGVVASIATDGAGVPTGLTIATASGSYRVVVSNASGNLLGTLGMNNLFTGTSAATMAVRSDIAADSSKLPVATMSTSNGSLSSLNNDVLIRLGGMMDTSLSFSAAGGMSATTSTSTGYVNSMLSNLSVTISAAKNRESFATTMLDQVTQEQSSVSGVNLNEELGLMIVYQQSFQASARIISVVDSMLKDLMQTIG